jgi:hypothetical protein
MGYRPTAESEDFIRSPGYSRTVSYFPGVATPYREIRILTPNTMLEIRGRRTERFYPRGPLKPARIDKETVERLSSLFISQVGLLAEKHSLAIPLSGGIDSRITLGAAFNSGNTGAVPCYTFVESRDHELDASVASMLCSDLGFRHITVPAGDRGSVNEGFMRSWRISTADMRADSQGVLCWSLKACLPPRDIHLRSTVSEVGRAFYRKKVRRFPTRDISPSTLARYYSINPEWEYVRSSFREYMAVTDFGEKTVFNYDPFDLFYWEHRNGAWQSLAVMDFDLALDTFILFNNRKILEMMLSVPISDRLNDRLHRALIQEMVGDASSAPLVYSLKPLPLRVGKSALKKAKYGLESMIGGRPRPYRFTQE